MIGQTLAHYKILEKIGSGGMGEVFLVEDTKLDRKVAVKVLPPELAESEERRARFTREAKAVAALNHPKARAHPGWRGRAAVGRSRLGVALVRGRKDVVLHRMG